MIKKYRKKPVIVEAMKYETTAKKAIEFCEGKASLNIHSDVIIETLEGHMTVFYGDYIIKGVEGDFYPCSPGIFNKTYEAVSVDEEGLQETESLNNQKKIKVPQYVATWMEENPSERWWLKIAQWERKVPKEDREVYNWCTCYNENEFIIAWITEDYEIEEEDRYYVNFTKYDFLVTDKGNPITSEEDVWVTDVMTDFLRNTFTESEIKLANENHWAYAKLAKG